jgi:hypothetical protein
MGHFQTATALTRRGSGTVFDAELDPQWTIGTKLHGGYLLALLAKAAAEVSAHPHLTAISGSFSVAPEPGPVVVEVEVLREGRSLTQLRARLSQHGAPCTEALITQGTLDGDAWWSGIEPIDLPAEYDCLTVPADGGGGFRVGLMEVVEQRIDPATAGFAVGQPSRKGVISSWLRLADGTDWDPASLLVALDPVPPISYDLGLTGWAPTIQMTAYLRGLPAPGPVRVRMRAGEVGGDRMDEVAELWDGKNRLIGQATQIAAVRIP